MANEKVTQFVEYLNTHSKIFIISVISVVGLVLVVLGFYYFNDELFQNGGSTDEASAVITAALPVNPEQAAKAATDVAASGNLASVTGDTLVVTVAGQDTTFTVNSETDVRVGVTEQESDVASIPIGKSISFAYDKNTKLINYISYEE